MSYVTELIQREIQRYYYDNIFVEGDLSIAISYFDDFYLFELVEEKDGEDVPLDLSVITDVNMVFFDDVDTVRISRMKNAANIDPSQGQVMFKISEEDSATILGLQNNNFYVTLISGTGTERDEISIIKSKFYDLETFNERILISQTERINAATAARRASLEKSRSALQDNLNILNTSNQTLTADYNDLVASYTELEKKYTEALGKLKTVPTNINTPFSPQNASNTAPSDFAVSELPVEQTGSTTEQESKSTKEKEQDLESNNEIVMMPTGGASTQSNGSGGSATVNPFNNIATQ